MRGRRRDGAGSPSCRDVLADLRGARRRAAAVRGRADAQPRAARRGAARRAVPDALFDSRRRERAPAIVARGRVRPGSFSLSSIASRGRGPLSALQRVGSCAMRIEGANALVTGGASGLGAATARRLVAAGAKAVIVDSTQRRARRSRRARRAHVRASDVTDAAQVEAAVAAATALGPLRVVSPARASAGPRTLDKTGKPHDLDLFKTSSASTSSARSTCCASARRRSRTIRSSTASAASSSTPHRSRRSTVRSVRSRTRPRRRASRA